MAEGDNQARELGEQAGEMSQGLIPVLGDVIEGVWDGLLQNPPDETSDAYRAAYEVGGFIPEAVAALWNFITGFIAGLFG